MKRILIFIMCFLLSILCGSTINKINGINASSIESINNISISSISSILGSSVVTGVNLSTFNTIADSIPVPEAYSSFVDSNPDITKLYFFNQNVLQMDIHQYSITDINDFSTISSDSKTFSFTRNGQVYASSFKPDGSLFYILSSGDDGVVRQFSMSTPWDISTAVDESISIDLKTLASESKDIYSFSIDYDFDKIYSIACESENYDIHQYSIADYGDISLTTYDNKKKNITGIINPAHMSINLDMDQIMITSDWTFPSYNNICYVFGYRGDVTSLSYNGTSNSFGNKVFSKMIFNSDNSSFIGIEAYTYILYRITE